MYEVPTQDPGLEEETEVLNQILTEIEGVVPPLWPLDGYVAVNPFVGLADQRFLDAQQLLQSVRDCRLLMPADYFRSLIEQGRLSRNQLEVAFAQCQGEYPDLYEDFELAELSRWLEKKTPEPDVSGSRFLTVAEAVDQQLGSTWSSHIINDISRHCGAYFDQGQAVWKSPWNGLSLYEAWRAAAQIGRRMDLLGLKGFRDFVARIPSSPLDAIAKFLTSLEIPPACWRLFLLCELFSISGWSSYVKQRVRDAEFHDERNADLIGLLAIRLAYDVALKEVPGMPRSLSLCPSQPDFLQDSAVPSLPTFDILARYLLQVAAEKTYENGLSKQLLANSDTLTGSARKTLQIVFCIDVRSEVMRRHLESISDELETFGFAGFFGMAIEYVPFGATGGTAQCPVLLKPGYRIKESLRQTDEPVAFKACSDRKTIRAWRNLWKSFQSSAASCFSFVETFGLTYGVKLLTNSLGLDRPVKNAETDGIPTNLIDRLGPDIQQHGETGISSPVQIDLAEGMLRNLGLTHDFGRIVVLCGHATDVVNNPYRAGLDCGACGGHSGGPNARIAAALLNAPHVRSALAERGILIPTDTWFVAAVHHTTTDEIQFCDPFTMPPTHAREFSEIKNWIAEAGRLCRIERNERLGEPDAEDLPRRSRDWSEVRPEWGLAGNAAFVIAPRSRTRGLDLGGRTFLHSYEYLKDRDFKTLELILTAPMIVTNWINLQYYASTVDNHAFGSGNKVIHNVVGQFGIFEGNGGDLMTGLPWQSVHDGARFQHEPLRLLVIVEAPRSAVERIVKRHATVRQLATNGWLSLVVLEEGRLYRLCSDTTWREQHLCSTVDQAVI